MSNNLATTNKYYAEVLPKTLYITLWASTFIVLGIGIIEILAWVFDIQWITNFRPNGVMMKANVAWLFILIGITLLILRTNKPAILRFYMPLFTGIFLLLLSFLVTGVYLFLRKEGYEEPVTETPVLKFFISQPNRMAILSAVIFFFIGIILVLMSFNTLIASNIAHFILFPIGIASYLVPASYFLNVYSIHEFLGVPVSLSTGITFCFVCITLFLLRPETWLMKVFSSKNTGGIMARKLFPWLVFLPLIIGWFRIKGEHTGLFTSEVGVVLVAITYTSCFILLVWFTAKSVNRIDEKRQSADAALKRSLAELRQINEQLNKTQEIARLGSWEFDLENNLLTWSDEIYRIFGVDKKEFIPTYDSFMQSVHPDDREKVNNAYLHATGERLDTYEIEHRIIQKDSEEILHVEERCTNIPDTSGKIIRSVGMTQDITKKKEIEESLNRSHNMLEALVLERTAELRETNERLTKEVIERKKAESVLLESQQQLRALTQRMDEIAEEERKNMAREIHDEMGHILTVVKYDLDLLINSYGEESCPQKTELQSLMGMVEGLIDTVRKISTELRPGILDHLGLFPAIGWQIQQFEKRTKITCHPDLQEDDLTFDKNETIIIFRILQEALTNAARHSKATEMWVSAGKSGEFFELKVRDNGIGFDQGAGKPTGSFGLMGMQERARSIRGQLLVESAPDSGTTITLLLKKV